MKHIIFIVLLALVALAGQAQKVKMNKPSLDDYLPLLQAKGYMAYSFNTKKFKGKVANVVVEEYVNGKDVGNIFDWDTSISLGKKIVVGFSPLENDSTFKFTFSVEDDATFNGPLKLRPVYHPNDSIKPIYRYVARPFDLSRPGESGSFIPLVLYGSFWYDAEDDVFRCCGENIIKPDLSSNIVKEMPHFYVFGIKINSTTK